MNRKGFTLAELLGVIIIIALLSLIIIPRVLEAFNEVSNQIDSSAELLIVEAAKDYYSENENYISRMDYCVTVHFLQEEGLLSRDLKNSNGELVPTDTIVKIYEGGSEYRLNERCNVTDNMITSAATSYYNDGLVVVANGTSKCITVSDLQNHLYLTKNAYRSGLALDPSTRIKITNSGTISVVIGGTCNG